jgi:hypothetical protein
MFLYAQRKKRYLNVLSHNTDILFINVTSHNVPARPNFMFLIHLGLQYWGMHFIACNAGSDTAMHHEKSQAITKSSG